MSRYFLFILLCAGLVNARAVRADVILDWNATLRNVMQTDGILNSPALANPGWSTRTIAMANTAMYDAFQAVNRTHQPFLVNTSAPGASKIAAAAQAAYDIILDCYPLQQTTLDNALTASLSVLPNDQAKIDGIALGHAIAQQCISTRIGDGADQGQNYTPLPGPGNWRPDPFNPAQVAWGPQWGTVDPFVIGNTTPFVNALTPPPVLNAPEYTAAWNMVKDYGDLNSAVRTADQEAIGLFWAYDRPSMGPPPVLFVKSLEDIAAQTGNTPEENARLFAMASVAQADAAIAAWDAKFAYNFWRPVAAIQEAGVGGPGDADGNPDTVGDPAWRPLGAPGNNPADFNDDFTPPFPAWTSGHATMGGAVFKAIELFYGTNVFDEADGIIGNDPLYSLTSQEAGSGSTRDYSTFTQTGVLDVGTENSPEGENGMSRIYLGIHWIFDQRDGITLGNDIAEYVFANRFQAVPEPSTIALMLFGIMSVALTRRVKKFSREA